MKPTRRPTRTDLPAHSPHGVGRPTATTLLGSLFDRLRRDPALDGVTLTVALTFLSLLPDPPADRADPSPLSP